METARIGAARSQVLSDAFNRSQIGRAVIEAKFSSYATHKILTGFAVGEFSLSDQRSGADAAGNRSVSFLHHNKKMI